MLVTMRRYATLLGLFAMLATGLTAIIHQFTQQNIAKQHECQQKQLLDQVVPPYLYDNVLQTECYVVTSLQLGDPLPHHVYLARKAGIPVAAAIESTAPDGYSGAIQLLVAADFNGKVLGVRVLEHHETPGLGDKIDIRVSNWVEHFRYRRVSGKNDPRWRVKKEGGDFDQFTGATITPRAVIKQVQRTTVFLNNIMRR